MEKKKYITPEINYIMEDELEQVFLRIDISAIGSGKWPNLDGNIHTGNNNTP